MNIILATSELHPFSKTDVLPDGSTPIPKPLQPYLKAAVTKA